MLHLQGNALQYVVLLQSLVWVLHNWGTHKLLCRTPVQAVSQMCDLCTEKANFPLQQNKNY